MMEKVQWKKEHAPPAATVVLVPPPGLSVMAAAKWKKQQSDLAQQNSANARPPMAPPTLAPYCERASPCKITHMAYLIGKRSW
jgi:hypothetical protein